MTEGNEVMMTPNTGVKNTLVSKMNKSAFSKTNIASAAEESKKRDFSMSQKNEGVALLSGQKTLQPSSLTQPVSPSTASKPPIKRGQTSEENRTAKQK